MRKVTKFFVLLLMPFALAGCSSITNLTPTHYPRDASGYYHFEAAWHTRERALRAETVKPTVVIGIKSYDMQKVPLVRDRWETFIPISADQDAIEYRYKVDFLVDTIHSQHADSLMSPAFKLKIVEK